MFAGREQFAEKRPSWLVTGSWHVLSHYVLNSNLRFSIAWAEKGLLLQRRALILKGSSMEVTESQGKKGSREPDVRRPQHQAARVVVGPGVCLPCVWTLSFISLLAIPVTCRRAAVSGYR